MATPDSETLIKKDPFRWVMLAFVTLMNFFLVGFTTQSLAFLLAPISEEMVWDSGQRAAIATAMSAGMVWFIFLAGVIMDKISVKKVIVASIAVSGVLVALRAQADGFTFFFAIMFLFGITIAFFTPADAKTVGLWFDREELPLANGIIMAATPLGMFTANMLTGQLTDAFGGWRPMYMAVGIIGVVLAVAFLIIGKNKKSEDASLTSDILTKDDLGIWKNIKGIVKMPLVWIFCLANIFAIGTLQAAAVWGNFVFSQDPRWGLSDVVAGYIPAFANFATLLSFIFLPMILKKLKALKYYMKLAIICGFITAGLNFLGHVVYSFPIIAATMTMTGLMGGIYLAAPRVLMLQLPEVSGPRAGTAMGIFLTLERLGITIFAAFLGFLFALPHAHYSVMLGTYYLMQALSPVLLILAAVLIKRRMKKIKQMQLEKRNKSKA